MKEIWKDINGYEGVYEVSNFGRVRSLDRVIIHKNKAKRKYNGMILNPINSRKGYLVVNLMKNSHLKSVKIHRLVAQAFIPNPKNLLQVNHKDEDKTNNDVNNLEWCTNIYNRNYGASKNRQKRAVLQYDMDGNFIREYSSTSECSTYGFIQGNVARCCRGEGNSHYGFTWKYKESGHIG